VNIGGVMQRWTGDQYIAPVSKHFYQQLLTTSYDFITSTQVL